MKKVLAVTVGTGREGQPADPIVLAIEREHPDYIVFFVSQESREITIPKVLERITYNEDDYTIFDCADVNNVIDCYTTFKTVLHDLIKSNITRSENIVVDYTSGTKAMSVALVLAGTSLGVGCLNYITGKRKNGIVVSGTELPVPIKPIVLYWERMHDEAVGNFNRYRFHECLTITETMLSMTEEEDKKRRAVFLNRIAEGYLSWDLFNIKKALNCLDRVNDTEIMKQYGCKEAVKNNKAFLHEEEREGEYSVKKAIDLYTNAQRRFEESRYDDAVARLYRLIEYLAQVRLYQKYGIETGNVDIEKIPPECKCIVRNYHEVKKIKIGFEKAYELLRCAGDELGIYFKELGENIKKIQYMRNNSILAHGFESIGEKSKELFPVVESLLEKFLGRSIREFKGAKFPKLK